MRKLHIIASVVMVVLFGFAAMSLAAETSVFDQVTGWVIRASTSGASAPYGINIEVVDTNRMPPAGATFTCSGAPGAGTGNPAVVANDAVNTDISMAFDSAAGKAYVFYTSQGGLQLPNCTLAGGPPPDTQPPAVSITSPGSGATVSGTAVTLSASASDNVGVVGVQFKVDGINVGAEDTSAPYSISWNSTTVANGSHTITAVARDAAGNSTTSAGVTVNVSNGGGGGGGVDLVITMLKPVDPVSGRTLGAIDNGQAFNIAITIANNGTSASGGFWVRCYFSTDDIPNNGGNPADQQLFSWYVNSLAGGQTLSYTATNVRFTNFGAHNSYYIVAKIDADNQVAESDEGNNVKTGPTVISVSR